MAFSLQGFVGGVAKGTTALIEQKEKDARELAKNQVVLGLERLDKIKRDRDESVKSFETDVAYVQAQFPQMTQAQLFEFSKNPANIQALKKKIESGYDPSLIDINKLVDVSKQTTTVDDAVGAYKNLWDSSITRMGEQKPQEEVKDLGFWGRVASGIQQKQLGDLAKSTGYSAEQLTGALNFQRPSVLPSEGAAVNLTGLTPETKESIGNTLFVANYRARESGDTEQIEKTSKAAINYAKTAGLFKVENQINSKEGALADIYRRAKAATTPEQRKAIEAEKLAVDRIWGDPNKDELSKRYESTANNLMKSYITTMVPSTSLVPDGQGGFTPKDIKGGILMARARVNGQVHLITDSQFVDQRTGLPVSNAARMALSANGVKFTSDGKATVNNEFLINAKQKIKDTEKEWNPSGMNVAAPVPNPDKSTTETPQTVDRRTAGDSVYKYRATAKDGTTYFYKTEAEAKQARASGR